MIIQSKSGATLMIWLQKVEHLYGNGVLGGLCPLSGCTKGLVGTKCVSGEGREAI